jgi:hypothetical protein
VFPLRSPSPSPSFAHRSTCVELQSGVSPGSNGGALRGEAGQRYVINERASVPLASFQSRGGMNGSFETDFA